LPTAKVHSVLFAALKARLTKNPKLPSPVFHLAYTTSSLIGVSHSGSAEAVVANLEGAISALKDIATKGVSAELEAIKAKVGRYPWSLLPLFPSPYAYEHICLPVSCV